MTAHDVQTAATAPETGAVPEPAHGAEIVVPLNRLKASPRNARKVKHSAAAIEALAASIRAKGVLQAPVVEIERDREGATTGNYLVTIGETDMAAIGTFIAQGDGYTGSIKTLTLNVKSATFRPNEKSDDKAPDYRIFAGTTEFGAAWKKTSQQNREYLSVKLDDPSFPAPIYASLVESDEGHSLIWSRN